MHLRHATPILCCGIALLLAVYWPGLHGPFLLDDFENLAPVWNHLTGGLTETGVIFGNRSGPLGRPLSMLSFLIDAHVWGQDAYGFKLTNLIVHIVCAALVWRLLSVLLPADPTLSEHTRWLAPTLALAWAGLPIHVSTVLYVVQRMALLSAGFVLLALLAYLAGRKCLQQGRTRSGLVWLAFAFPGLTLLAILCKENGVLAIPMAAAIEYTCFERQYDRRPWVINALFAVSLALPLLAGTVMLIADPSRLTDGYVGRSFTLTERVLTEPRILWDYIRSIVTPHGPSMGLFHDDYPVSYGLLTPPSTALAIAGWVAASILAWRIRSRAPMFSFGTFFFLAAHALESSILPLELYFEHRNYLASLGIVVALAALPTLLIPKHLHTRTLNLAFASMALLFPAAYLLATHLRASVWSSDDTLYVQEELNNSTSPRLQGILAARAMERGDLRSALTHIDLAEEHGPTSEQMTATVRRMLAYCATGNAIPEALYTEAKQRSYLPATQYGMIAWEMLAQRAESNGCEADNERLARTGIEWMDDAGVPDNSHAAWRIRYNSARLLASAGNMKDAAALAARAFRDSGDNFGVGVLAFQTCASSTEIRQCAPIATRLALVADPNDRLAIETAAAFVTASTNAVRNAPD